MTSRSDVEEMIALMISKVFLSFKLPIWQLLKNRANTLKQSLIHLHIFFCFFVLLEIFDIKIGRQKIDSKAVEHSMFHTQYELIN